MTKVDRGRFTMRSTTIVPESIAVLKDGQTVAKGQTVSLPVEYGRHLVDDRFADHAEPEKATTRAVPASAIKKAEGAVKAAEDTLAKAETDEAKTDAQRVLDDAMAELAKLTS